MDDALQERTKRCAGPQLEASAALFGSQAPWWFDPASNFFAVVLGAIIGGVISFVLSRRASKEVLDRDAAARSDQRKAAVFRLSVSLIVTVGVLGTLRAHLKEQLSKAGDPAFRQRELWELVKPMAAAASDEIPTFDIEGLSILFRRQRTRSDATADIVSTALRSGSTCLYRFLPSSSGSSGKVTCASAH